MVHTEQANNVERPAQYCAAHINALLIEGRTVVWLMSGGSAVDVAVRARRNIVVPSEGQLHVGLVDERFGPVGHGESNDFKLNAADFDYTDVAHHPILITGKDATEATERYGQTLAHLKERGYYFIGLFGLGTDGHTAGLLPNNPVQTSEKLVEHYTATDFERITITPTFIEQIDAAVVYAMGERKWPAMQKFLQNDEIPAKVLHKIPTLTVYSDYKESAHA